MHTYKDLVNEVLLRMREDTVTTIGSSRLVATDDPVVDIVKLAVVDAQNIVQNAHQWNAERTDWTITTAVGTHTYSLTNAGNRATIDTVYASNGTDLRNVPLAEIHKKSAAVGTNGTPYIYAANGVDNSGNLRIRFYNTPDSVDTYTVHGFKKQAPLNLDGDVLLVPDQPVIYLAFALASRERGETGGAQSSELFVMADQYLRDAIALDSANTDLDNTWVVS